MFSCVRLCYQVCEEMGAELIRLCDHDARENPNNEARIVATLRDAATCEESGSTAQSVEEVGGEPRR